MDRFLINNRIHTIVSIPDEMHKIVIYCHGFGEAKECILRHNEILNKNNIGIIGFDFPSHGEEDINYHILNYDNCLSYLNDVVNYVKEKYPNIDICLMGCSFGGYIVLNYINTYGGNYKTVLNYPGVNFYDALITKMGIDINYFNDHDSFYHEKTGYTLYKDCFLTFYNHDIRKSFNSSKCDYLVMHGDCDHTVVLSEVEKFCHEYNLKLDIFKGERHGLLNSLDKVNEKIINFLK